jgi:hypothetical protein
MWGAINAETSVVFFGIARREKAGCGPAAAAGQGYYTEIANHFIEIIIKASSLPGRTGEFRCWSKNPGLEIPPGQGAIP